MVSEGIYCSGCGITLRPFMKSCPRCGTPREDATPLEQASSNESEKPAQPVSLDSQQTQTNVVPLSAIRQQRVPQSNADSGQPSDMVFLSPNETGRRFPLFTRAQLTLIAIGAGLLILGLVIAYLLWRQQKRDYSQTPSSPAVSVQPSPLILPTPEPSPTLAGADDQTVFESVKNALTAYNPLGISRYKFEVKEGVVTLNGEAEHQPEKDGAENVIKLVNGVKSVVNNLKVKPEQIAGQIGQFGAVKVNPAEARILEEALRKQLQGDDLSSNAQPKQNQPDPQREAERIRREQQAAKQREEELAQRKAAEDKLRRETEEYEKRQEEIRRAEADRRARAEQARLDASVLRSGTVAWSGLVDGTEEIIFSGNSASVRHISGNPPRDVRASFSAPIPRSPANVKLIASNGRGSINIMQQPSAANGYTTIVRVDDSAKGGEKRYDFTLRWSIQ